MKLVRHAYKLVGVLVILLAVGACSTPSQTLNIRQDPPADIPLQQELISTPFFPQEKYHCGPAALAMVIKFRDIEVEPDEIVPLIYVPGRKGSLQEEVVAAVRRYDLLPVKLDGELKSILREIASGNPVLVMQNLGLNFYPKWHYAVAVGYNLPEQTIVLRSGLYERLVRPFSLFERTWKRAGYWSLAIVPPEVIPNTVDADRFLNTVIEFEQTGRSSPAHRAYLSAANKWPSSLLAQIGIGNTAYALGEYDKSESAYKKALELSPQKAEVWNNLAYALVKQGKSTESLDAIEMALQISPDNANYLQSQAELRQWAGKFN